MAVMKKSIRKMLLLSKIQTPFIPVSEAGFFLLFSRLAFMLLSTLKNCNSLSFTH